MLYISNSTTKNSFIKGHFFALRAISVYIWIDAIGMYNASIAPAVNVCIACDIYSAKIGNRPFILQAIEPNYFAIWCSCRNVAVIAHSEEKVRMAKGREINWQRQIEKNRVKETKDFQDIYFKKIEKRNQEGNGLKWRKLRK